MILEKFGFVIVDDRCVESKRLPDRLMMTTQMNIDASRCAIDNSEDGHYQIGEPLHITYLSVSKTAIIY